MKWLVCWVLLSLLLACGGWSGGPDPRMGAEARDAGRGSDSFEPDSAPAEAGDGGGRVAGARSAAACGELGRACGPGTCPDGLGCENGACVRSSNMCGGSAAAACPASAPVCLTYSWATGWPCVTRADRDCICEAPAGRAGFSIECGAATRR